MQDKPLEKEMARCDRNLLVVNVCILALWAFCAYANQKYWYNFAFGPFPIEVESLFADNGGKTPQKEFVTIKGEKTIDTKKAQVKTEYDRKTNEVKSEETTGYYLLLRAKDKAVIVKSPVITTLSSFEGKLEEIPDYIKQVIIQPFPADVQKRFSPFMLEVEGYRSFGFIALFFGTPLTLLALWNLRKLLMRKSDRDLHPIMKTIKKQGDPRQIMPLIDEELRSPETKSLGGAIVMRNWVAGRFMYDLDLIAIQQLVWVYKLETRHSVNFIPTGTTVELVINTSDRRQHKFSGNRTQVEEAIKEIFQRAPWIYAGYSDELKKAWGKNPTGMIEAVEDARKKHQADNTQKAS